MTGLIHYRCPVCDEEGDAIPDPKQERLICTTDGCRVREYAPHLE